MDASSSKEGADEPVSSALPIQVLNPAARSVGPGGGQHAAPAARSGARGAIARFTQHPWFPVAARAAAIFAGMLGLAAVGAASTLAGAGISIALPRASAAPSVSGVWLAPDPPGSSPAPAAANAVPAPTADAPDDPNGRAEVSPNSSGLTPDGKVILNVATADELKKLPRVGSKRAQAILDLRHKVGRFQRPTDLLRVHGIGRKTLKLMLPLLVLDPPGAK